MESDKNRAQDSQATGKLIQAAQARTLQCVAANSNSTLKGERPGGYTAEHLAQFNYLAIDLATHPDTSLYTKNRTHEAFVAS